MKRFLSSVCFVFVHAQIMLGCTFIPESFCYWSDQPATTFIVSGTIIGVDDDGIDFEIMDILKGEESNSIIRIWDGTDFDCNGIFSMAGGAYGDVGDQFILILPEITTIENTWDVIGDYRWPDIFTATTLLHVQDGQVNGFISGVPGAPPEYSVTSFPYDEFISSWIENEGCTAITNTEDVALNPLLTVFPNPSDQEITITSESNKNFEQIKILDYLGNEVYSFRSLKPSSKIPISTLNPGLYFLYVEQSNRSEVIRFLKI